ncbi:MAG: FAD-dependent monooxygenase [Xanthobacteraceae bacterium]|nr:FAD-dependent monooxygenase [Xanthobacteraceae bacterium]
MRVQTVAVAGCGLAGLAAALLLHRDGHRVTLFERFATPRPLGSGLMIQRTGLAVLRSMGLDHDLLNAGARINRLIGKDAGSGRTVLDVRYAALGSADAFGIGIHRAALFELLHRAVIAAGIAIENGRSVTGAPLERDGQRRLTFADGPAAGPFDLVVDTLGIGSPLVPAGRALAYGALWASFDWPQSVGRNKRSALRHQSRRPVSPAFSRTRPSRPRQPNSPGPVRYVAMER